MLVQSDSSQFPPGKTMSGIVSPMPKGAWPLRLEFRAMRDSRVKEIFAVGSRQETTYRTINRSNCDTIGHEDR